MQSKINSLVSRIEELESNKLRMEELEIKNESRIEELEKSNKILIEN